jgi:hypothetical protein
MPVHDVAWRLPEITVVRAVSQSIAVLDATLCRDWQYRYFSFDSRWAPGEELASMRNGSGDEYSIVFTAAGVFVRGFNHESPMSPYGLEPERPWPGFVDSVPPEFAAQVTEPAFAHHFPHGVVPAVTACLWRQPGDERWHAGTIAFPEGYADPDGANWMFEVLADGTPESYCRHAGDYFGQPINAEAVRQVYAHTPLTDELVAVLNPDVSVADLAEELATIAYPA